jgi:hypothetical protein
MNTNIPIQQREVVIGQHVHCTLYGGRDGIIVEIHGQQSPQSARSVFNGVGVTGGNADFDIIWDDGTESRKIPESLARHSVQWRLIDKVADADEIGAARAQVVIRKAEEAAKQVEADKAYALERDEAIAKYPHLTRLEPGQYGGGGKHAAKNIRIELKAAFPKVKFSVTSDYDSLRVRWQDGPTEAQVSAIADRYCNGGFDAMQDMAYSTPSAFTDLFGGARYTSCGREVSDELLSKALDALFVRLARNLEGIEKPDVAELRRSYLTIPHLQALTLNGAASYIASCWDATGGCYHAHDRRIGDIWLVWDDGKPVCMPLS